MEVIEAYEQRNRRFVPIIRWVLSRQLGWQYDGSEPSRRRAVAQLPLIAFRPMGRRSNPSAIRRMALLRVQARLLRCMAASTTRIALS